MLFILTVNTVFIKIVCGRNISLRYDNTKEISYYKKYNVC